MGIDVDYHKKKTPQPPWLYKGQNNEKGKKNRKVSIVIYGPTGDCCNVFFSPGCTIDHAEEVKL